MGEHKLSIKSARGLALGQLNPENFATTKFEEGWITVVESSVAGVYDVVGSSLTGGDAWDDSDSLGLAAWDEDVEDTDRGESDGVVYCDTASTDLQWDDVRFQVLGGSMWVTAPSVERIAEALEHVAFKPFDAANV